LRSLGQEARCKRLEGFLGECLVKLGDLGRFAYEVSCADLAKTVWAVVIAVRCFCTLLKSVVLVSLSSKMVRRSNEQLGNQEIVPSNDE
jgi:hypothetical protein